VIDIQNHEVGGYAYNNDNTLATEIEHVLATEIERVLAEQLLKDSMDGTTGLRSTAKHTLREYKVTNSIKCKDGEKTAMVSQETESAYATTESKGRSRNRYQSKSSDGKKEGDRNKKEMEQQGWTLVDKGSKVKCKPDQYYTELSNAYSSLAEFSANPSPDDAPTSAASLFKLKSTKCRHQRIQRKIKKKLKDATDTADTIIEQYIDMAEDECTGMAKSDKSNTRRVAIDTAHS